MIPKVVGGTETYLRQTLLAMAQHHRDVELVLFTNRDNDTVFREDLSPFAPVSYHLLDFSALNRPARILREQTQLPLAARKTGIDVLWSPGYTAPAWAPCPQVVTILDMQYKTHPEDLPWHYRCATDVLVRLAARRCNRIIAISDFTRDEISRYTAAGPEKIDVTHLAADPTFAEDIAQEGREASFAELPPIKRPFILTVSHTHPHKNLHALVDAFGEIMDSVLHSLVMVGSARLGEDRVQESLQRLPDASSVVRLEKMSFEQLKVLYRSADLFVLPSLYEGFGLPVLEAMMAGTPVVTTRKGSLPELGGDAVTYFDPAKPGDLSAKMTEVLSWSPKQREQHTAAAQSRARSFSWQKTAAGTLAVLQSVRKP